MLGSAMEEREHTNKHYEQQLRILKEKLLLMSHKAEMAIAIATTALIERRPSLAEQVVHDDDELDQLEIEIDNLCFELWALAQPVARDLRFIATVIKIVNDIERIADNGVNIARRALEMMDEGELKPIIDDDVYEQMFRELLTYMLEDPSIVSRALRLIFVAKNLERVGDHAVNIAEMVIFLVQGQDIRHAALRCRCRGGSTPSIRRSFPSRCG